MGGSGLQIGGLRRHRRAVLAPDRVVERERRRGMAQADDDRDLAVFEAITAFARGEDVRREVQRLADTASRDRVQKRAVLAGYLVEPLVLGMARWLPSAARRSLGQRRGGAGAECGAERGEPAAEPREERSARREGAVVGALHVYLTSAAGAGRNEGNSRRHPRARSTRARPWMFRPRVHLG